MSLFVHPENQKILWNIINGNPFIIRYFEAKPPQEKEAWFRKSIEEFYTRIQGKEIDPQELNHLNKELLTNMIQSVHIQSPQFTAHNSSQVYPPTPPSYQEPQNTMHSINTPPVIPDSKEEIFNKQFQMRQQEYDTMLHRNTPNEIDFREVSSDENKDINELLERERREREELMKPITQSNKINIQETNNIKLETMELEEPKEKKNVSWGNDRTKEDIDKLFEIQTSEMYSMRLHIIDLTKQLAEMGKRVSNLETHTKESKQPDNEKTVHNVSKYANLGEFVNSEPKLTISKTNETEVLVEDVNSDSDSGK